MSIKTKPQTLSPILFLHVTFFPCCRQRDKLEDMLRDLTPERAKIAKCMVFCVNHADCAEEVSKKELLSDFSLNCSFNSQ